MERSILTTLLYLRESKVCVTFSKSCIHYLTIYISSIEIRVALQYFNAVTLDIILTMEWMKEEGCQKGLT